MGLTPTPHVKENSLIFIVDYFRTPPLPVGGSCQRGAHSSGPHRVDLGIDCPGDGRYAYTY